MLKIYTKTGDKGTSCLYNGERLSKDSFVFHALGDVDELNSALGIAREHLATLDVTLAEQLEVIQSRLLDVGSVIATPAGNSSERKLQRVEFDSSAITDLEKWIDAMDTNLPPLKNFILPSGGLAASSLHFARAVCRRAERSLVPLFAAIILEEPPAIMVYLNRLSDYLFTLARRSAQLDQKPEVTYCKA